MSWQAPTWHGNGSQRTGAGDVLPRGLSAGGGRLALRHETFTFAPVGAGRHLDFRPGGDAAAGGRGAALV